MKHVHFQPIFRKKWPRECIIGKMGCIGCQPIHCKLHNRWYICFQSLGILKHERVLTKHLKTSRQWKVSVERLIDILRKQLKLGIQSLQSCTSIFTKILNSAGVATIVRAKPGNVAKSKRRLVIKTLDTHGADKKYTRIKAHLGTFKMQRHYTQASKLIPRFH